MHNQAGLALFKVRQLRATFPNAPGASRTVVPTRGAYNSDDITRVGVGGGGVEPGGSDHGMTITICSFFALQVCVFASHSGKMCQEIIALCGLSSWDT